MTLRIRLVAGAILALSLALPLWSVPAGLERTPRSYGWALAEAHQDWVGALLVLAAFLWPFAALSLLRAATAKLPRLAVTLAEPLAAIFSSYLILMLVDISFQYRNLFVIFWLPVAARPEVGYYVALGANALYLLAWLWDRVVATRAVLRFTEPTPSAPRTSS